MIRTDSRPCLPYDSAGVQTGGIIFAGPCELIELEAKNNAAATRYLMLFDLVAPPANGVAYDHLIPVPVPPGGFATVGGVQIRFPVGLSWSSSSTDLVRTVTLAADMIVTARFRRI